MRLQSLPTLLLGVSRDGKGLLQIGAVWRPQPGLRARPLAAGGRFPARLSRSVAFCRHVGADISRVGSVIVPERRQGRAGAAGHHPPTSNGHHTEQPKLVDFEREAIVPRVPQLDRLITERTQAETTITEILAVPTWLSTWLSIDLIPAYIDAVDSRSD